MDYQNIEVKRYQTREEAEADSKRKNQEYIDNLYAKRAYYNEVWNIEYNRSQCLKLTGLTGHQFDYALKQFDIKVKKVGHAVILTAKQLFDIKLAIRLKESECPLDVIKEFFSIRDKNLEKGEIILDYAFPIPGMKEYKFCTIFSFSDESGVKAKILRQIDSEYKTMGDNQIRKAIHRYFYQNDKGNTWFLFLDESDVKAIGHELIRKIQGLTFPLETYLEEINNELQTSSKKHDISIPSIPDVA